MNVRHLAFRKDSVTCTVANALSVDGRDVFVWVVDPAQDNRYAGRPERRLRGIPRVRIIARDEAALPSTDSAPAPPIESNPSVARRHSIPRQENEPRSVLGVARQVFIVD